MHARTNWPSDTIGGEEKKAKRTLSKECAHTSFFSSPSPYYFCSFSVHVTNGRQLKLGLPRAFKRRHFRSHVRNESSGTRIDASTAQKDVDDVDVGRVAPLRFARRAAKRDLRPSEHSRSELSWFCVLRYQQPRTWRHRRTRWVQRFSSFVIYDRVAQCSGNLLFYGI